MNNELIKYSTSQHDFEPALLLSFIEVETGGEGFGPDGKILIQFEPLWFKKIYHSAPYGLWSINKVENQKKEWLAFNDAYSKNAEAAMKATSIGLGQILGLHYKRLGFDCVSNMWINAKESLYNQFIQFITFLKTDRILEQYIKNKNWDGIAKKYNGERYKEYAIKYNRISYDIALKNSYYKYLKIYN